MLTLEAPAFACEASLVRGLTRRTKNSLGIPYLCLPPQCPVKRENRVTSSSYALCKSKLLSLHTKTALFRVAESFTRGNKLSVQTCMTTVVACRARVASAVPSCSTTLPFSSSQVEKTHRLSLLWMYSAAAFIIVHSLE